MATGGSRITSCRAVWSATLLTLGALTAVAVWGPLSDTTWRSPDALFAMVTGCALACIVAATGVIVLADRREMAELGLLGSALLAAALMPLVHGLLTPGVLYNETPAFRGSTFLALPAAIAVAAPLLTPHSAFGRWASRRWRDWTLLSLLATFVLASAVVFYPDSVVAPPAKHPGSVAFAIVLAVAIAAISLRQLRLYEIGRSPANLIASLSLQVLGVTVVLPLSTADYSLGFWWLHVAGMLGVAGTCVALASSKRIAPQARDLLAPVLSRDPLVSFDLCVSPVVHRFVADLAAKDQITRDHVVRTAEMAVRVGERCKLSARQLRDLGLAALLHDVGKLDIPTEILAKPARLTADEYEIIKRHAEAGEAMLAAEVTLASVAPLVRSHHERIDGRGYPDGLVGTQIPLASRIIAVCDAFDAMTHDRQYRAALPVPLAFSILREHAGSQWDPFVIDQAIAVLATMPASENPVTAGRPRAEPEEPVALDVDAMLVSVDAEI